METPVNQGQLDLGVNLVLMDRLDNQQRLDSKVLQVSKVHQVPMDSPVPQALQGSRDLMAPLVLRDLQELEATQETLDHKVKWVLKVPQAL